MEGGLVESSTKWKGDWLRVVLSGKENWLRVEVNRRENYLRVVLS